MLKMMAISPTFSVIHGAVNCGLIRGGSRAILIDCCDSITPTELESIGINSVEMILFTQYRRPNTAGVYAFLNQETRIVVPEEEGYFFDQVDAYWKAWKNRWHVYQHQPGPLVLPTPIPVSATVKEKDRIEWNGNIIEVLATPGSTDGAVSYIIEADGKRFCFCGDTIYAGGKLWDLYSLQKGNGRIMDYHGFLGNKGKLTSSLEKLQNSDIQELIPSHGPVITDPQQAIDDLMGKLESFWKNYISISSLNHYFPGYLTEPSDTSLLMQPVKTHKPPDYVKRIGYTSFALIAEDKSLFLIDCGHDMVVHRLHTLLARGKIRAIEGCWVTHYHDDHVDSLGRVFNEFGCPIFTEEHMAEILTNPSRYFLPCISPNPTPVTKAYKNGESWQWHEFKMTAYHFPGQTYYHSGLLVERVAGENNPSLRIFFAGDSGSPTGIDDHCPPNRNFLGKDVGFRRCLSIWKKTNPDHIFNQHQERSFSFTPAELEHIDQTLADREVILHDLVPWQNPNFGLDENWIRTYPYEQTATPGSSISIDVQITNHHDQPIQVALEPVLPSGWNDASETTKMDIVPPSTSGIVGEFTPDPDFSQRFRINLPPQSLSGKYVIPFRLTWNGNYLGQIRHALVNVVD